MVSKSEQQKRLENAKDLFEYLENLPKVSLLKLYGDETYGFYACRAVLQSALPEIARQYTLRLAVCGGSFSKKDIQLWHSSQGARDAMLALRHMISLAIIEDGNGNTSESKDNTNQKESNASEENGSIRLTPEFHKGILKSISSLSSTPWNPITSQQLQLISQQAQADRINPSSMKKKIKSPPTLDELEIYTQRRWESVLHYLVGSSDTNVEDPPEAVKHFLESTGLMQDDPDHISSKKNEKAPLIITSKGYEFMLQDTHLQVWKFMLQLFLSFSKYEQADELRHEALLFLIALSYCKVGDGYLTKDLIQTHQEFLKFFKQLGLLYTCKLSSNVTAFYPTRVSVSLVSGSGGGGIGHGSGSGSGSGNNNDGTNDGGNSNDQRDINDSNIALGPSASSTRVLESALAQPKPSSSHIAIIWLVHFVIFTLST